MSTDLSIHRVTPTAANTRAPHPAVPRSATSILLAIMVVASLAPSLLPRSSLTQAIVTGVAAALGLVLSAALHRMVFSIGTPTVRLPARRICSVGAIAAIAAATVADARWQNSLRAAMGTEPTSALHWAEMWCGAVSICAILVVFGVGCARGVRALGAVRTTAAVVVAGLLGYGVIIPMTLTSLSDRFAVANASVDLSLPVPAAPRYSGSAQSSIGWDSLGREGRKFTTGGDDVGAVRTYVPVDAAPTTALRASIAVQEMERAGGFTKSHVVLAVPTGSGWIDANAVSGIEDRFGGDVATVGLQYSYQPSWATFLFAKSEARDSAKSMLDAVRTRIAALPPDSRPDLYVYGQSLGAIGGSAAVAEDPDGICGALWAGPPAGEVASGQAVILANTSDPVIRWTSGLITSPPDLDEARVDAPMPRWIPLVSYVQTTVDLISALSAPAGHGHRYGDDQGTSLPDC